MQTFLSQGGGHNSINSIFGATDNPGDVESVITQTGILIPSGTVVEGSAWVKSDRNTYPNTFTCFRVYLDGTFCGEQQLPDFESGWRLLGPGTTQLLGDTHTIRIEVFSNFADEASIIWGVDDVVVLPISGPAVPVCLATPSAVRTVP
jgi:hypothetical protein